MPSRPLKFGFFFFIALLSGCLACSDPDSNDGGGDSDADSPCPDGYRYAGVEQGCVAVTPKCPAGMQWQESSGTCRRPADGDADDGSCSSFWDCPYDLDCGPDGACSVPGSGSLSGQADCRVESAAAWAFDSQGLVAGSYRSEGIRIGAGVECVILSASDTEPSWLFVTWYDILSDEWRSAFSLTVRTDRISAASTLELASGEMTGYYRRYRVDSGSDTPVEDQAMAQISAGRVEFGAADTQVDGLIELEIDVQLGPIDGDPGESIPDVLTETIALGQ